MGTHRCCNEGQHGHVKLTPPTAKKSSLWIDEASLFSFHHSFQRENNQAEPVSNISESPMEDVVMLLDSE